jgi:hypothetical protein
MTATPPDAVLAVTERIGTDGKPDQPPRERGPNGQRKRSELRQQAAERRVRVSALLIAKKTHREIAAIEQVSVSTIVSDVAVVRAAWVERSAQLYGPVLAEEIAKLDAMERGLAPRAMLGEESAITVMLRIAERRSKLLGLDQPAQMQAHVVTQHIGPSAAEQLAQLEGADRDDRAIGIAAVLIEAGAIPDPAAIDVESRERARIGEGEAGEGDDAEADEVHRPGPDDEAGRVPAA